MLRLAMLPALFLAHVVFTLSGCANRALVHEDVNPVNPEGVEKIFIGVPVLAGAEGSTVRLNEEWVLTVAHNWPILVGRDVVYHPQCDIALIRDKGDQTYKTDYIYFGETAYLAGYPMMRTYTVTKGEVIQDFTNLLDGCLYTAVDAAIVKGMSGGGVFDSDGHLVGVNMGWVDDSVTFGDGRTSYKPALIVSLLSVKDWIESVTGVTVKPASVD